MRQLRSKTSKYRLGNSTNHQIWLFAFISCWSAHHFFCYAIDPVTLPPSPSLRYTHMRRKRTQQWRTWRRSIWSRSRASRLEVQWLESVGSEWLSLSLRWLWTNHVYRLDLQLKRIQPFVYSSSIDSSPSCLRNIYKRSHSHRFEKHVLHFQHHQYTIQTVLGNGPPNIFDWSKFS